MGKPQYLLGFPLLQNRTWKGLERKERKKLGKNVENIDLLWLFWQGETFIITILKNAYEPVRACHAELSCSDGLRIKARENIATTFNKEDRIDDVITVGIY